jgi:hypothetical protein
LAQRLTETRAAEGAGSRLDPYARSLVEHTRESTERDISWLDRLIESERARPHAELAELKVNAQWKGNSELKGMTEMEGEAR